MPRTLAVHPPGRMEAALVWWARGAAVAALLIAAVSWIGWATGIDRLTRFFPSWPPMMPWTAVLVAALGVAALAQSGHPSRERIYLGCGMATLSGALAVVFLAEHTTGQSFGLDQLWFSESVTLAEPSMSGRPSRPTAISALLLSLATGLTRLDRRWTPTAWALGLAAATAVPLLIVVGYGLESLFLLDASRSAGMAISTATALMLLATATIATRTDRDPLARLLARPDRWTLVQMVGILATPPVLIGMSRPTFLNAGLRDDVAWVLSISVSTIAVGAATFYLSQHTQKRLLEAQERNRLIVANAPSAISIRNREERYELVNQAFCELAGITHPHNALGRTADTIFPLHVLDEMRTADSRAWRGQSTRFEHEVSIDSKRLTVDAQVFPVDSGQGQITGIGMISTDITERKRVERQMRERLDFETFISAAINDGNLVAYAQPIVDARTRQLIEEELLVRIVGPDGQLIAPDTFLPQARRFGLMPTIDRFMVDRGIELAQAGRAVAVNLSAHSIGDRPTLDAITDEIRKADDLNGRVSFEITEHAALASLDVAEQFSNDMKLLGCKLALDDFGTGFGAFTELRRLTLHNLKIDMSFVRGLLESQQDESVVKMIIRIAREFGLTTTAEGVEDSETLARLIELGVDQAQGYLIGAPAPATSS